MVWMILGTAAASSLRRRAITRWKAFVQFLTGRILWTRPTFGAARIFICSRFARVTNNSSLRFTSKTIRRWQIRCIGLKRYRSGKANHQRDFLWNRAVWCRPGSRRIKGKLLGSSLTIQPGHSSSSSDRGRLARIPLCNKYPGRNTFFALRAHCGRAARGPTVEVEPDY